MNQDRVCRQCGAAFGGSPHSHYCPECRARLNAKYRAARGKRLRISWNKERVVEAILERHRQGLPLNWAAVQLDASKLTCAARQHCGGWNEALAAAGLDPAAISLKRAPRQGSQRKWSPEAVIEAIRADAEAGMELSFRATIRRSHALTSAGRHYFGTWEGAVSAAGYDYSFFSRATLPQVLDRIRSLIEADVDFSEKSCRAWDADLLAACVSLFGSWEDAVKAAGVDPDEARRTVRWSRSRVLEAIRSGRSDRTLQSIAGRYWGSWGEACSAAGISAEDIDPPSNRIRARRKELGLSQVQLAGRVGVSHVYIGRLERDCEPPPRVGMALRLARALECSIEDLYGADPPE